MRRIRSLGMVAAAALALDTGSVRADYYSHPELRPANRCIDDQGRGFAATGIDPINCQKLIWDLPAPVAVDTVAVGAPFVEDSIPRFPNGLTDRIPPMFVGSLSSTGTLEGFETLPDCDANAGGCHRLCSDDEEIPYWKRVLEADGKTQQNGFDPTGKLHSVTDPKAVQSGPLFQVACQRGSRAYFGPWQVGTDPARFDVKTDNKMVRFENSERLNKDVDIRHATTESRRLEWNTGTEIYNHFGSHHGTCYQPSDATCANSQNPQPREAYDDADPNAACRNFERGADGPDAPMGQSGCHSASPDTRCRSGGVDMGGFRNGTQLPGRLSVAIPDGRGAIGTEDQIWGCNHHVVTQLPPGSYGMNKLANYRLQKGGLVNDTTTDLGLGVAPNQAVGGTVGEMIFQYFTQPLNAAVKPASSMFNAVPDAATTYYPPFTWQYHETQWVPPYDASIAVMSIHSHHRMVKGTMNIDPANPPRLNSSNPDCGGGVGASNLYTDWTWEEAPVCEYWREPDGPVTIRKGETIRTTCYVNNGVTPEAIKHGLVAGASVEALKTLGAPIPEYPQLVPASTWGDALATSPVGTELLYGTHPPINYRVVYKCTDARLGNSLGSSMLNVTQYSNHKPCSPNPVFDDDGDYIDGAYRNDVQCGVGGICEPSSIIFACVGEDEMCIGVAMYWALPRLGNPGTGEEAVSNLESGDVDHVGTPGDTGVPSDGVYVGGSCPDCKTGL